MISIPTPGRILYLARRRVKLGLRHGYVERHIAPRIMNWRPSPTWPVAPVPIHFLTSQHDWKLALWMLASFHYVTSRRWPVTLHDDGSLGDVEFHAFRQLFPDLKIIRRREADEMMAQRLSTHSRCAAYRRAMPHGLKSFDIPCLAAAERFIILDPDVFFFSTPTEILRWADQASDPTCWFNRDLQESSPLAPDRARVDLQIALWPQVNSGLCLLTKKAVVDLDAMESWLGHPALQAPGIQWRVEQALLALAASRFGRGGLLPDTYEVSSHKHRRPGSVARHYVGTVRDRFLSEAIWSMASRML